MAMNAELPLDRLKLKIKLSSFVKYSSIQRNEIDDYGSRIDTSATAALTR